MELDKQFDFYVLNTAVTTIANTANSAPSVQIGNEYDFEVTAFRGVIRKAADATGDLLCTPKLSGGLNLVENPLNLYMFCQLAGAQGETASFPITVPWVGAIIPANTRVIFEITNNTGADVFVQVAFVGRKIFKNGLKA
jgi:hypothetical protein